MKLDCHIHIGSAQAGPERCRAALAERGMDGAIFISLPPPCHRFAQELPTDPKVRLENLMAWTSWSEMAFPFFWIDPVDETADEQVDMALEAGVDGFKVICGSHYPSDERAIPVYRRIAEAGKPMLFHSGILWDGKPSGVYNRPVEFECLMEVPGLRFALAHISWPWVDECLAVYGKILSAHRWRELTSEMFIDTTPGTPPIYRREALTKLYTIGYDVENNVLYGSDTMAGRGHTKHTDMRMRQDGAIFDDLGLSEEQVEKFYARNLLRFLGKSDETVSHETPVPERTD